MAENPNSRYPTQTNAPDADYPYGSARNISVPGDGTGTPWEADIVNDLFGWQQQLLTAAGIVPSGNPDKVGASQYFDAIRATCGYPGTIVPVAFNADPATLGLRILILDGSGILRANYPELDASTYVGDTYNNSALAFVRADSPTGSPRNTTGAYLILPDARGQFIRGTDPNGTEDPDRNSPYKRLPGYPQGYAFRDHYHQLEDFSTGDLFYFNQFDVTPDPAGDKLVTLTFGGVPYAATTKDTDGSNLIGNAFENRPNNINFTLGIWY